MTGLSKQEVARLMEPKQTTLDVATARVFDRLMESEFVGNASELAHECDLDHDWLRAVLDRVREPEWVEENGWTIPFVRRGAWQNTWFIADVKDGDSARMQASQFRRAREIEKSTQKNISQCRLALAQMSDKRSSHARRWTQALKMYEAAEVHMEALIESFDNEAAARQ